VKAVFEDIKRNGQTAFIAGQNLYYYGSVIRASEYRVVIESGAIMYTSEQVQLFLALANGIEYLKFNGQVIINYHAIESVIPMGKPKAKPKKVAVDITCDSEDCIIESFAYCPHCGEPT